MTIACPSCSRPLEELCIGSLNANFRARLRCSRTYRDDGSDGCGRSFNHFTDGRLIEHGSPTPTTEETPMTHPETGPVCFGDTAGIFISAHDARRFVLGLSDILDQRTTSLVELSVLLSILDPDPKTNVAKLRPFTECLAVSDTDRAPAPDDWANCASAAHPIVEECPKTPRDPNAETGESA